MPGHEIDGRAMKIGEIKISYEMAEDGDVLTNVEVDGELPFVTQLGLLEMAKDTLLRGVDDEEDL